MASLVPKKMKVAELREALAARNFTAPSKWLKEQLVEKLEEVMKQEAASNLSTPPAPASSSSASDSLSAPTFSSSSAPVTDAVSSAATVSPSTLLIQPSSVSSSETTSSHVLKLSVDSEESLDAKKRKRAEKFGVPVVVSQEEKQAARAAKFGGEPAMKKSKNTDDSAKLAARAAKCGTGAAADSEEKKRARALKFSTLSEEEKAKQARRAERFGSPAPAVTAKTINLPSATASSNGLSAAEKELMEKRKAKFATPS